LPKPLVIVPMYLAEEQDLEVVMDAVRSVRNTVSDSVEVLVVDDFSPAQDLVAGIEPGLHRYDADLHRKQENSGFSKTVNIGLRRALNEGRDAVLMNADMEMLTPGWASICRKARIDGEQAAVIGALLFYPNDLIQHAGIYFSILTRNFNHMYRFGPRNLPDAYRQRACPVTAAFQYIRHGTLEKVGIYDENFFMAHEDVDYCVRVQLAGLRCLYEPKVRAYHAEAMFRGRPSPKVQEWETKSWLYFAEKWEGQVFNGMIPFY
jgi:GT2 family glycosyltransferase